MSGNYKVWFVDDLPQNLEKFKKNHSDDFDIELFAQPSAVLRRISNKDYPDALLCDVFFYDSVEEAERVERQVGELAEQLKKTAANLGLADHKYAAGIILMENIYKHFKNQKPPFPMYAYTSKGPFLLEQKDWQNISDYGAEVLLKNRVTPESEKTEIVGDIEFHRAKNSWRVRLKNVFRTSLFSLWPGGFWLIASFIAGWLSHGTWWHFF